MKTRDNKHLIKLRAELRREYKRVESLYKINKKASLADEDSDSYDAMQRLGGRLLGLEYALVLLKDSMFLIRHHSRENKK